MERGIKSAALNFTGFQCYPDAVHDTVDKRTGIIGAELFAHINGFINGDLERDILMEPVDP